MMVRLHPSQLDRSTRRGLIRQSEEVRDWNGEVAGFGRYDHCNPASQTGDCVTLANTGLVLLEK